MKLYIDGVDTTDSVDSISVGLVDSAFAGDGPGPKRDKVNISLIDWEMREVVADPQSEYQYSTKVAREIPAADTSPVFDESTVSVRNLRWTNGNTQLLADNTVTGTASNQEANAWGAQGRISDVKLAVNDETERPVTVTHNLGSNDRRSIRNPFSYSSTFSQTVFSVPVTLGQNEVKFLAASLLSQHQGHSTWNVNIQQVDVGGNSVLVSATPAFQVKSEGGTFHPIAMRTKGPKLALERLQFITPDDGGRAITRATDGHYYMAAKGEDSASRRVALIGRRLGSRVSTRGTT